MAYISTHERGLHFFLSWPLIISKSSYIRLKRKKKCKLIIIFSNIFKRIMYEHFFALVNEITLLSRGLLYPFIIYYTYIFYNRVFSIIVHHFNGKKTQRLRKLSPTSRIFASNYSFLKNISILYPYLAKINGFFYFLILPLMRVGVKPFHYRIRP